jgi:hypothetical protein
MNVLVALAALVAVFDYFGVKPKSFALGNIVPIGKRFKLGILLILIVANTAIAIRATLRVSTLQKQLAATDNRDKPYPFEFHAAKDLERVENKTFINERVILDGKDFRHCKFQNVTFVYNGTGPFSFAYNELINVPQFYTDNLSVLTTLIFAKLMGCRIGELSIGPNDSPIDVEPMQNAPFACPSPESKRPALREQ